MRVHCTHMTKNFSSPAPIDLFGRKLLPEAEGAKMLGLSVQTLRNMRCRRNGPSYFKLGGKVMFAPEDLVRFVDSRHVKTKDCP